MGHDPARSWDAHPRSSKYFMNLIQVVLRLRYHLRMGHGVADLFPSIGFCSHIDPLPSKKALTLPNLPDPSRSPTPPNHITPQPPKPQSLGAARIPSTAMMTGPPPRPSSSRPWRSTSRRRAQPGPGGRWSRTLPRVASGRLGGRRLGGEILVMCWVFPFWLVCN